MESIASLPVSFVSATVLGHSANSQNLAFSWFFNDFCQWDSMEHDHPIFAINPSTNSGDKPDHQGPDSGDKPDRPPNFGDKPNCWPNSGNKPDCRPDFGDKPNHQPDSGDKPYNSGDNPCVCSLPDFGNKPNCWDPTLVINPIVNPILAINPIVDLILAINPIINQILAINPIVNPILVILSSGHGPNGIQGFIFYKNSVKIPNSEILLSVPGVAFACLRSLWHLTFCVA